MECLLVGFVCLVDELMRVSALAVGLQRNASDAVGCVVCCGRREEENRREERLYASAGRVGRQ